MFDYHAAMTAGHGFNEYVADVLTSFGISQVAVPELELVTDAAAIKEKTKNEKDVLVGDLVLEVKSSSRSFTSIEDFPHNPLIVDTVYGYEQKTIKPFAYIIISQLTKAMFVIPCGTHSHWEKHEYWDKNRQLVDDFYMVKKSDCRLFIDLVDELLSRQND